MLSISVLWLGQYGLLSGFPADALAAVSAVQLGAGDVKVGDTPEVVLRELGQPLKRLDEAGARIRWVYGEKAGETIQVYIRKGRVESLEFQETPARDLAVWLPLGLLLVELEVLEPGDSRQPHRWVAHPSTGRVWRINPKGLTSSWSIRSPWKARVPGKPLAQILAARIDKKGRK